MVKVSLALRHVAFEGLGSFGDVLLERGFQICYLDPAIDDLSAIDPRAPDLIVVLGGPLRACADAHYPFLRQELDLLDRRMAADRPTVGIGLGSRLMARGLGGRIVPSATQEIGWRPVELTDAGVASPLSWLAVSGPERLRIEDGARTTPSLPAGCRERRALTFHWRDESLDLPAGADLLATSPTCPCQAFRWGRCQLAMQFHPEVRAADLERWLVGYAREIDRTPETTVEQLRGDAARHAAAAERRGRLLFRSWLDGVGL